MPPPELLQGPRTVSHGIDPTKIQLPCAQCKAILNVPHGLSRFSCPQCKVELAVDVSKFNYSSTKHLAPPPPPPPEEVNEVAIEVEREEDGGGVVGETFTDYRPPKVSIVPPHPDPVVETASLSAVQPPDPTYDLLAKDNLESLKALSCLQFEALVYASQCMHGPNCKLGDYCTTGRRLQEVNVLGGLILPVWGTIEKALAKQVHESHRRLHIVRLETTTDNQQIVGLLVPNAVVNTVLKVLVWVQDIDD